MDGVGFPDLRDCDVELRDVLELACTMPSRDVALGGRSELRNSWRERKASFHFVIREWS